MPRTSAPPHSSGLADDLPTPLTFPGSGCCTAIDGPAFGVPVTRTDRTLSNSEESCSFGFGVDDDGVTSSTT